MPLTRRPISDAAEWDKLVQLLPGAHVLQSWLWGEVKRPFGWTPTRWVWEDSQGRCLAAAQLLRRRAPGPLDLAVIYCPKGPILDWSSEMLRTDVLLDLMDLSREPGVIQLKIDPDVPAARGSEPLSPSEDPAVGTEVMQHLSDLGWTRSEEHVQFTNTMVIDLSPPEDELLANMKQKARYNIRLAAKKGVLVRPGGVSDLDLLFEMYAETSIRDGFVIRTPEYYQEVWGRFVEAGLAQPLIAEVEGRPVAALILFTYGQTAWYLYGMSRDAERDKMPNHLLQWEAIRWAKGCGLQRYDLWGAPDAFDETDPMWGVYRFKEGFDAQVLRTIGPWDYTTRRLAHWGYSSVLPRVLGVMRRRGRQQTAELLS